MIIKSPNHLPCKDKLSSLTIIPDQTIDQQSVIFRNCPRLGWWYPLIKKTKTMKNNRQNLKFLLNKCVRYETESNCINIWGNLQSNIWFRVKIFFQSTKKLWSRHSLFEDKKPIGQEYTFIINIISLPYFLKCAGAQRNATL